MAILEPTKNANTLEMMREIQGPSTPRPTHSPSFGQQPTDLLGQMRQIVGENLWQGDYDPMRGIAGMTEDYNAALTGYRQTPEGLEQEPGTFRALTLLSPGFGGAPPGTAASGALGRGVGKLFKPFYSEVEQTVANIPQNKAAASQWYQTIKKTPGVKEDELEWMGLREWLNDKKTVTKEELQDFIDMNKVEIKEIVKGGRELNYDEESALHDALIEAEVNNNLPEFATEFDEQIGRYYNSLYGEPIHEFGGEIKTYPTENNAIQGLVADLRENAEKMLPSDLYDRHPHIVEQHKKTGQVLEGGPAKWEQSDLLLPGEYSNYREFLFQLPQKGRGKLIQQIKANPNVPVNEDMWSINVLKQSGISDELIDAWDKGRLLGRETYQVHAYDEPNILAWVRFNERNINGKNTLFLEEIQSDWAQDAQKLRKAEIKRIYEGQKPKVGPYLPKEEISKTVPYEFGYQGPREPQPTGRWEAVWTPVGREEVPYAFDTQEEALKFAEERLKQVPDYAEGLATVDVRQQTIMPSENPRAVPQQPFKKTDQWASLVMKRMIRYAVENDIDQIAWTTGRQQVDRYSSALRQNVDTINWKKTEDGIHLEGYKGREPGVQPGPLSARQLEPGWWEITDQNTGEFITNVTGDNAMTESQAIIEARRRIAEEPQRTGFGRYEKVVDTKYKENELSDAIGKSMAKQIIEDSNQTGKISGTDIKIDDVGMAGFYDRILPNLKFIKKMKGKVNTANLQTGENAHLSNFRVNRSPRGGYMVEAFNRENQRWESVYGGFDGVSQEVARNYADKQIANQAKGEIVHIMQITPKMKETAVKGMPMFSITPIPMPSYGENE